MRRTRYDIMIEILKLCTQSRRITEIVYECNLNFGIVNKYLFPLINTGWIKKENKIYTTTETGHQKLEILKPAMALISVV